jgi:glycerol-3-phosphate O-acyltransferase
VARNTHESACKVHLKILSQAWKVVQRGGTQRLVERFLDRFWTNAFHRQRFRFHSPREVERAINELSTLPLGVRSRRLLGAIADDFGIILPPELRAWCQAAR